MIVKTQKPIEFVNECGAIVDYKLLEKAMLGLTDKPIARLKKIFLHGKYPAISIHGKKIHIHRLVKCYAINRKFLWSNEYVHHKNENKLDARISNLELLPASEHQFITNKGRKQSTQHVKRRISATTRTRYGH